MPRRTVDDELDDDEEEYTKPRGRVTKSVSKSVSRRTRDEDDDEEEAPRSRRRAAASDEDEDDEKPARRRASKRPAEDDDEDDAPRPRRRAARDDDEDEDPPARRRASKRSRDDDDEDDAPRAKKNAIRGGWDAAQQVKDSTSSFAQTLKLSGDEQVIKFLDDEPYSSYKQHWMERKGQKSFTCIADANGKGCDLCAIGDSPAARFGFNVVLMGTETDPINKSLEAGVKLFEQLKNFNADKRNGPLSKHYWSIARTGKGQTSSVSLVPIKEADLEEEWDIVPLDPRELKALQRTAYDSSIVSMPTKRQLREIADEVGD